MFKLRMPIDKVSLFAQRFRAKEPTATAPLWDGEILEVPDEFAASAKELFDKGFALTPDELKAHAVYLREETEAAGVKVGDVRLATDTESVARIALITLVAASDPSFKVDWKTKTGNFVGLDANTFHSEPTKRP